jgi:hypothetical protein
VYADKPDVEHGGTQPQGSVNLPGWTRLDVLVAGRRYAAADASAYRQTLDLRRGVVTTTATWSVGRRETRLTYDVTLDRARERVGLVRLQLTPSWSGSRPGHPEHPDRPARRHPFDPVAGDAVRLRIPATRFGGQNPKLAELAVRG